MQGARGQDNLALDLGQIEGAFVRTPRQQTAGSGLGTPGDDGGKVLAQGFAPLPRAGVRISAMEIRRLYSKLLPVRLRRDPS